MFIFSQLKLAHEGNNVEWWDLGAKLVDTLRDDEDKYEGSGDVEGSGVGFDDEDDAAAEGSGDGGCVWDFEGSGACDDEDCCRPPWKSSSSTTEAAPESASTEATTAADDITIEETTAASAPSDRSDGGSGAAARTPHSAMSLLPLLTALWWVAR